MKSVMTAALLLLSPIAVSAQEAQNEVKQERPPEQSLQRANKLALPTSGISHFELDGEGLVGYSSQFNALIFKYSGNVTSIFPPAYYSAINMRTGELVQKVQIEPYVDISNPAAKEEIERQEAKMEAAGNDFISRWKPAFNLYVPSQTFTGWVEPLEGNGARPSGDTGRWRFYIGEPTESGWFKPVLDIETQSPPHFKNVTFLESGKIALLAFERDPVNPNDRTHRIYVALNSEVWAQFLNEIGFELYGKRNYKAALYWFDLAVKNFNKNHMPAAYNAACSAALLGWPGTALDYLKLLRSNNGTVAWQYLNKVASDRDFDSVRQDPDFSDGLKVLLKP